MPHNSVNGNCFDSDEVFLFDSSRHMKYFEK